MKRVLEAEEQADGILQDAKRQAAEIVDEAKTAARQRVKDAREAADAEARKTLAEATARAEEQKQAYAGQVARELDASNAAVYARADEAADAIIRMLG